MKQVLFALISTFVIATASDLDTLKVRYYDMSMSEGISHLSEVASILASQNSDGSFTDITYGTTSGAGNEHPVRLQILAAALVNPDSEWFGDSSLKSSLVSGIDYWVTLNLQDDNWWYRYIKYPKSFWPSIILADSILTAEEPTLKARSLSYLKWAWLDGAPGYQTGANLADIASATLPAAVVDGDSALSAEISFRIQEESQFTENEGIHRDYSYSQHTGTGLQLYSGTYGAEFAKSTMNIAYICRNTDFAFTQETTERIESFFLDGVQWTAWKKVLDYNSIGRAISRTGSSNYGGGYFTPIAQLTALSTPRQSELEAWYDRMNNAIAGGPEGNRSYWHHDFMVQRNSRWYSSVRGTSTRTVGNESGNGEGLKNYHMGDGVLMHMVTGDEYRDIFPLWDWHKIPGITAEQHGESFPLVNWGAGGLGGSSFVGGASDSSSGVFVMKLDKAGVTAHKFWFFTDSCIVALGAAVSSGNSSPIVTTVEQNHFVDRVTLPDGSAFTNGETTLSEGRLFHNGSAYEILDIGSSFDISVESRTGSWSQVNSNGSTSPITQELFTLTIDHGIAPENGTYAYGIIPGAPEIYKENSTPFPLTIVENSDTLQAVLSHSGDLFGAAFIKSGTCAYGEGNSVTLDRPGVVLVTEQSDTLFVTIADPAHTTGNATFTITGEYYGYGASYDSSSDKTTLMVSLPTGEFAGSGITTRLLPAQSALGTITGFAITNRITHEYVEGFAPIPEEAVIPLSLFTDSSYNIEALYSGYMGSVIFGYDTVDSFRTENSAPFTLFDELKTTWVPDTGTYSVTATPFLHSSGTGAMGELAMISFRIVDEETIIGTVNPPKLQPALIHQSNLTLEISLPRAGYFSVELFTLGGRSVYAEKYESRQLIPTTISLPHLASGVYMISVRQKLFQLREKVMIQ